MSIAEPALNVFPVVVQNELGSRILAQTHALCKLCQAVLHLLVLLRRNIIFHTALLRVAISLFDCWIRRAIIVFTLVAGEISHTLHYR